MGATPLSQEYSSVEDRAVGVSSSHGQPHSQLMLSSAAVVEVPSPGTLPAITRRQESPKEKSGQTNIPASEITHHSNQPVIGASAESSPGRPEDSHLGASGS